MAHSADVPQHRRNLLAILQAALAAVNGRHAVREHLRGNPLAGEIYAVAVGKAAGAMIAGAFDALGGRIARGLVITKTGHSEAHLFDALPVTCLEAAHPLPDERSLQAGAALLDFVRAVPPEGRLLFLISGGTS